MESVEKRIKSRIVITEDNCWVWSGARSKAGYGRIGIGPKNYYVHRVMASLHFDNFNIHSPLSVCHKCDNTSCVNPEHLFIGTHSDNERDKVAKGRHYYKSRDKCKNGHSFSYTDSRGARRRCNTCQRAYNRRYRANRKAS